MKTNERERERARRKGNESSWQMKHNIMIIVFKFCRNKFIQR